MVNSTEEFFQRGTNLLMEGIVEAIIIFIETFGGYVSAWIAGILLWKLWKIYQARKQRAMFARCGFQEIDEMEGEHFEKFCGRLLKRIGYQQVRLTPKVGDYGVDILAVTKSGEKIGIQCKRYRKNVGIKAIQEAYSGKSFYQLNRVYVVTNSYFTAAAKKVAKRNEVFLVDREKLAKWIRLGAGEVD